MTGFMHNTITAEEAARTYAQSFITCYEPSIEKHTDVLIYLAEALSDQAVQQRVVTLLSALRQMQLSRDPREVRK